MTTRAKKPIRAEKSSGNVFADLGLPHPQQELVKAKLTLQIYRLIKRRGLRQAETGRILGIKQPHVSALMRNRSGAFSVERRCLRTAQENLALDSAFVLIDGAPGLQRNRWITVDKSPLHK